MKIAVGNSRMDKKWKNRDIPWEDFCSRVAVTIRTTETVEEYQKEWNGAGNHPRQAVFTEKVQPLIERFFKENDEMLKAVQW